MKAECCSRLGVTWMAGVQMLHQWGATVCRQRPIAIG